MKMGVVLDGEIYELQPSFAALSKIERELGAAVTALSLRLIDGAITLEELVIIVAHCLEPQMPKSFLESALLRSGFTQVVEAVASMFALIFSGSNAVNRQELQQMMERFPDTP
jgi:hypothetical protein